MPISKNTITPVTVVTSVNQPVNKNLGLIWNELNNSGNLIESWNWFNNRWVSPNKSIFVTLGNRTGYLPLLTTYNYLFKSLDIWLLSSSQLTNTLFGRIFVQIAKDLNATNLFTETFNNQAINTSLIKSQVLNQLVIPTGRESIRFLVEKTGGNPTLDFGVNLGYQLVRK